MRKDFNISGKLTIQIDFDITAENEEQALREAREKIKDFYHLDNIGAPYHVPINGAEFDLDANEYDD
jgi:hypothetical protein